MKAKTGCEASGYSVISSMGQAEMGWEYWNGQGYGAWGEEH